ncbi:transposase [Micromonospora chersina]|uniref:transposase n=1 Tax=Micromonospora chersina TaxID=47854 RepID=UPI0037A8820B
MAKPRAGRPSILDDHLDYLHQRLTDGVTNANTLFTELRVRGHRGSATTLRTYLQPLRAAATPPPLRPRLPKVRRIAAWLLRHPDALHPDDRTGLAEIRAACPHLNALVDHVKAFAEMLTNRHGYRLNAWITAVTADDQPDLHSFIAGLRRDHDAVLNGLTLPQSSGVVEGHVNRIKMIKRQMYGRANLDLLRKRILLARQGQSRSRKMGQIQFPGGADSDGDRRSLEGTVPRHPTAAMYPLALPRTLNHFPCHIVFSIG